MDDVFGTEAMIVFMQPLAMKLYYVVFFLN
jgi:hypothetical protein